MSTAARLAHSPDQVRRLRIDLDLSKNPRLKDMFRQPEFHLEIRIYLRQNDLEMSGQSTTAQGRIRYIEVTGSAVAMQSFVDRYLRSDVLGIAYNLDYL